MCKLDVLTTLLMGFALKISGREIIQMGLRFVAAVFYQEFINVCKTKKKHSALGKMVRPWINRQELYGASITVLKNY
jgi:hypothetical protein